MYTIKALKRVYPGLSFIEVTLNTKGQWVEATNQPMQFNSTKSASYYWTNSKIQSPQLGSDGMPYIIGPRGARYAIRIIR